MISLSCFRLFSGDLTLLHDDKLLINTLNAYSFCILQKDKDFFRALYASDILLPDGVSITFAERFLFKRKIRKIAGADLFFFEMAKLEKSGGKCFFLGSTQRTLDLIQSRAANEYKNVTVETFSPPFKKEFSNEDNEEIIGRINRFKPDVLFVGMTAPKQEIWAHKHFNRLCAGQICCIGAVFDFYAGTVKRAPEWMIRLGLEWFYRLIREPRRMWKRYLIGNLRFVLLILREKVEMLASRVEP